MDFTVLRTSGVSPIAERISCTLKYCCGFEVSLVVAVEVVVDGLMEAAAVDAARKQPRQPNDGFVIVTRRNTGSDIVTDFIVISPFVVVVERSQPSTQTFESILLLLASKRSTTS